MPIRWLDAVRFDKSVAVPVNAAAVLSPRSLLWAVRVQTLVLAPSMALAIGAATTDSADVAGIVATAAWGAAIAVLVLSLVVPSPLGLTAVRLVLPATVPAAVVALAADAGAMGVVALAAALIASLTAVSAETAEAFVQASAYGDEHRFPMRPPAALLVPMVLSWLVWCAATLGAVVLLATQQWVAGAVVALVAGGLTSLLARRFHRFSRRWLVIVPAGVVIHDHVVLGETLLLQRGNIALARLAPATTEAADFTGPAAGHAVEVAVREMVLAVLAPTPADPKGKALHVQSLLVAPSRPGRALQAIAAMRVPVG